MTGEVVAGWVPVETIGLEDLTDSGPGPQCMELLDCAAVDGASLVGLEETAVVDASLVALEETVDLTDEAAEEELAAPPPPLPEHLPPDERVTSTQFFWPSTGVE